LSLSHLTWYQRMAAFALNRNLLNLSCRGRTNECYVRCEKKQHPQTKPEMHTRLQSMPAYVIRITVPADGRMWICKHNQYQRYEPSWFSFSHRSHKSKAEHESR